MQTKEFFPAIDGLKAFSAIGILLMHVLTNSHISPSHNFVTDTLISPMGELVLLFMMLSAFGLCCGYYRSFKNGKTTPSRFYSKRYLKILPFFAILVVLDLIVSPSPASACEAFADLTLAFGLYPDANISVIGVGWFLGTIFVFYMIFPFFVYLLDNKRRAWVAFAVSLVWQLMMIHYYGTDAFTQILVVAPYFLLGGIVYLYRDKIRGTLSRSRLTAIAALLAVVSLTIIYHVVPQVHETLFGRHLPRLVLYGSWLVYAVAIPARFLANAFTAAISAISMEVYLCHMVVYRVVEKLPLSRFIDSPDVLYIVSAALTLLGAVLTARIYQRHIHPRIPLPATARA